VDPWVLGTDDPNAEEPALLWNGLIGIRVARNGGGVPNGFFTIDSYGTEGEEKILPLPNPLPARSLRIDVSQPYAQRLDMRTGILTTAFTTVDGVQAEQTLVIHPRERMLGERWSFEGGSAPDSKPDLAALNAAGVRTEVNEVPQDHERVISFGSGRASPEPKKGIPSRPLNFDDLVNISTETWSKRWQTDIEIDGPVEDQQAVRSFLYYLRSAIHPEGQMSVSPFALSSEKYNGHVFWDADIWVFPALALVDPQAAAEIARYRLQKAKQAAKNGTGPFPAKAENASIVRYPWESSVSGRETVPGPSAREAHITGSVLWGLTQAERLGLVSPRQLGDLPGRADRFYRSISVPGPDGAEIRDIMSPDENHIGDNDLYTNLLAQWLANDRRWEGSKFKYKLPKDDETFLTYDDDALRGYKQAAAVLATYPLQYPPAEAQARAMMERFADKTIENGPAMSDSVHALIWARLGEREKAYATWRDSWVPFTRHPLMLFSEKRRRSETYFTTGAGGALQTVLLGFLGMRLDSKKESGSAWSSKLPSGAWLSTKPNLPKEWKSVKFRNFAVAGKRYTMTASSDAVSVVPGG
jgi:trehalose/maltose hydrolase-like predicted phosphorylase